MSEWKLVRVDPSQPQIQSIQSQTGCDEATARLFWSKLIYWAPEPPNLVERAGEPVAWREVVRATGRVRSHIDWQPTADMIEASDMEEADWQPLYYIPPAAPGASHER